MKTFDTYDEIKGMRECKKTATAHAVKITEPFRVDTLEGDYAQGKEGDYLMRGIEGELYICDANIFRNTYEFI